MASTEAPGRPWAASIALVLLGLVLATFANVAGLSAGGQGAAVRVAGALGYATGLLVAGVGLHRLLWFGPSARPRWVRVLVTALVTPPVFAVSGVVVGALMMMFQARFAS